jgi:uncharacterized protein (DUF1786 family)
MIDLANSKRILAVDVGAGTQDIFFFDPLKTPENNVKLVLPSQTQILARQINKINEDILIEGDVMGGGPITSAISSHLKKGYRVVMTHTSAKTVRDDLDEVREEGIEIVSEVEAKSLHYRRIEAKDVDIEFILGFLSRIGESPPDMIGVALQDHGFEKGTSDREFRFEKLKEILEAQASLEDFLFLEPPKYYTRMNSALSRIKKGFKGTAAVIDSKFAAIAGALHGVSERPCLCIDVGNGHTMISLINENVDGILEHHTHALSKEKLEDYIIRFAEGDVTNEEVFNDYGHGCHLRNSPGIEGVKRILVTGPNRSVLKNSSLDVEFSNPYGDVMITGAVGIVDLMKAKFK